MPVDKLRIEGQLSPKVLVVASRQRLSWQYHYQRAEIWRVARGAEAVSEEEVKDYQISEQLLLAQGQRLVGLAGWGVVAEIRQHTDANNPSDEDDIGRVRDDFGR